MFERVKRKLFIPLGVSSVIARGTQSRAPESKVILISRVVARQASTYYLACHDSIVVVVCDYYFSLSPSQSHPLKAIPIDHSR